MSRLMFGVVLGTAIQYLLEPEDPAILDSLTCLSVSSGSTERWYL